MNNMCALIFFNSTQLFAMEGRMVSNTFLATGVATLWNGGSVAPCRNDSLGGGTSLSPSLLIVPFIEASSIDVDIVGDCDGQLCS